MLSNKKGTSAFKYPLLNMISAGGLGGITNIKVAISICYKIKRIVSFQKSPSQRVNCWEPKGI